MLQLKSALGAEALRTRSGVGVGGTWVAGRKTRIAAYDGLLFGEEMAKRGSWIAVNDPRSAIGKELFKCTWMIPIA